MIIGEWEFERGIIQFDILFPCMVDMGIDMGLDIGKKRKSILSYK